jgi:translation elongation factor P/translation initiation factor 5A
MKATTLSPELLQTIDLHTSIICFMDDNGWETHDACEDRIDYYVSSFTNGDLSLIVETEGQDISVTLYDVRFEDPFVIEEDRFQNLEAFKHYVLN